MKNLIQLISTIIFFLINLQIVSAQCDTLIYEDADHFALGSASIGYINGTDNLRISNIGSSGQSGVRINLEEDREYGVIQVNYLTPIELDEISGSMLKLTGYHKVDGMPETEGSILQLDRIATQYISIFAEFPEDGNEDTVRVQIFKNGNIIGEFYTPEGIVGHLVGGVAPLQSAATRSSQGESIPGVNISLEQIPGGIVFKLNGDAQLESPDFQIFEGDHFSVEPLICPDTNIIVSGYSIQSANIPDDKIDIFSLSKRQARTGRNPQTGHTFNSNGLAMGGTDHLNILAPDKGLMVYDTNTTSFWFYGNEWKEATEESQNSGQSLTVSFLGDTLYLSSGGYVIVPGISAANYPGIRDGDGNLYSEVILGNQIWLGENLRTTKFNDGAPITFNPDNAGWPVQDTAAYTYQNNNAENAIPYGALYNWWAAIDTNICPVGFHLPTFDDWDELKTFLGGTSSVGGKLKEVGLDHWNTPNAGATDEFGFTGIPGGSLWNGDFYNQGNTVHHWSAWQDHPSTRKVWELRHGSAVLARINAGMVNGYSIRCVKN